jgi:hypothetical protein
MDTYFLLVLCHIIGTILGVGGATMIEIHLNMALRDGKMDVVDREFMGIDFLLTRIGLAISFITGIGFIWIYATSDQLFRLENGVFWGKMAIIAIIIGNAYLLDKHKISLYWGSAFSFVSWWTAMILGMFLTNNVHVVAADPVLSFITVMGVYGVCVIISAFILHKIREAIKARYMKNHPAPPQSPAVS